MKRYLRSVVLTAVIFGALSSAALGTEMTRAERRDLTKIILGEGVLPPAVRGWITSDDEMLDIYSVEGKADAVIRRRGWTTEVEEALARDYSGYRWQLKVRMGDDIEPVLAKGGVAHLEMPVLLGNFEVVSTDTVIIGRPAGDVVMPLSEAQPIFHVKSGARLILENIRFTSPGAVHEGMEGPASDDEELGLAFAPIISMDDGSELVMRKVTFDACPVSIRTGKRVRIYAADSVWSSVVFPIRTEGGVFYLRDCSIVNPLVAVSAAGNLLEAPTGDINAGRDFLDRNIYMDFKNCQWYDYHGKFPKGHISSLYYGADKIITKAFTHYTEDFKHRFWLDFDAPSFASLAQSGLLWFDDGGADLPALALDGSLLATSRRASEFPGIHDALLAALKEQAVTSLTPLTAEEEARLRREFDDYNAMIFYRNETAIKGAGAKILMSYLLKPLHDIGADIFSPRSEAWWKGRKDRFDEAVGKVSILYDIIVPGIIEWGFYPPFLEMTENQFRIDGHSVAFLTSRFEPGNAWEMLRPRILRYYEWLRGMDTFKNTPSGRAILTEYKTFLRTLDRYVRYVYFDVPMICTMFSALAAREMFDPGKLEIRKINKINIESYMPIYESGLSTSALTADMYSRFHELPDYQIKSDPEYGSTLAATAEAYDRNIRMLETQLAELSSADRSFKDMLADEIKRRREFLNAESERRLEEKHRREREEAERAALTSQDAGASK